MTTRTRKAGPERREEIARAVMRIIGEQGLASLTTASLADAVGLSSGALFRHFPSREAILEEAVRVALREIEQTYPTGTLPPRERLFELARNRVRLLRSRPGIAWLLRSEEAFLALPPGAVSSLRRQVTRSRRFLLDAIREGIEQGSIRDDVAPENLLVTIVGTIQALSGMGGVHRPSRRAPDPAAVLEGLEHMIAPLPTGVRPIGKRKSGRASKGR